MDIIGNNWDDILQNEYRKDYFVKLLGFLEKEYNENTVYPPRKKIFSAFRYVNYEDVKVVILGQDPYHGTGQANGMAFAVSDGIQLPPSLINIYKEIESDIGVKMPRKGSLIGWAKQGILLLNSVLTVKRGEAYSHSDIGWQAFTDATILSLNASPHPIVYILWGAGAIAKKELIDSRHCIITSSHPSPLSAYKGFFGSKPFSRANEFLAAHSRSPIDWAEVEGYEPASYYKNCEKIHRA